MDSKQQEQSSSSQPKSKSSKSSKQKQHQQVIILTPPKKQYNLSELQSLHFRHLDLSTDCYLRVTVCTMMMMMIVSNLDSIKESTVASSGLGELDVPTDEVAAAAAEQIKRDVTQQLHDTEAQLEQSFSSFKQTGNDTHTHTYTLTYKQDKNIW